MKEYAYAGLLADIRSKTNTSHKGRSRLVFWRHLVKVNHKKIRYNKQNDC